MHTSLRRYCINKTILRNPAGGRDVFPTCVIPCSSWKTQIEPRVLGNVISVISYGEFGRDVRGWSLLAACQTFLKIFTGTGCSLSLFLTGQSGSTLCLWWPGHMGGVIATLCWWYCVRVGILGRVVPWKRGLTEREQENENKIDKYWRLVCFFTSTGYRQLLFFPVQGKI